MYVHLSFNFFFSISNSQHLSQNQSHSIMSKTTSTTLESLNIKPDELNTTMETLEKLAKAGQAGFDLFNTRPMKRLRKAVVPFLEEMRKKFAWDIDAQERKRNLKRKRNTVGLICSLNPNTAAIDTY